METFFTFLVSIVYFFYKFADMDEKRLEILERASAVYMKYGIKSVTMDDLARELGISKKTIYVHFKDKNELVRSIIQLKIEMDKAICINCVQQSENAIDDLIQTGRLVADHIGNVNPSVFYDLKKYHQDAWQLMENHKWDFVLTMIRDNIKRGIEEGIYRADIDIEVVARLYVGSTDLILGGDAFPWPEFTFERLFKEMVRLHIMGMANEKGTNYLNKKLGNENA